MATIPSDADSSRERSFPSLLQTQFNFLQLGDVFRKTDEAVNTQDLVPQRKLAIVNPAQRAIRSQDTEFLVHPALQAEGALHALAVIRVNGLDPIAGVFVERLSLASPKPFVSRAYVNHLSLHGVENPEDIIQVFHKLTKALLGLAESQFRVMAGRNVPEQA